MGTWASADHGAFLLNFRESWQSHFSEAKTWQFGSASEHRFDWNILLRNWDTTVPATFGVGVALFKTRSDARLLFPLAWLYADDLMLSFYTDIPMPPEIAVVPLKRLWSGEMTAERMAAEFARYRPELAILNNSDSAVPFRDLLDSDYRMVYEDNRYQLYAVTNIILEAQAQ